MNRSLIAAMGSILTALAVALGVSVAPAMAAPIERVVKDGKDAKALLDLKKATLQSGVKNHDLASVNLDFYNEATADAGITIYFNTDGDKKPEFVYFSLGGEYAVYKTTSWTKTTKDITAKNCVQPQYISGQFQAAFNPNCLAKSKQFSVNVFTYDQTDADSYRDYLPKKNAWTKPVKSFRPLKG